MKRVLVSLACFLILVLTITSCKKTCGCQLYIEGEVIRTETEVALHERYSSCSELGDYNEKIEAGRMCYDE